MSEEAVIALARLAQVEIASDRLPAVAETLHELLMRAKELDLVDVADIEPEMRFDAHWTKDGA